MEDQSRRQTGQGRRHLDRLQPTKADTHGCFRLADLQELADLRDGPNELCRHQGADRGAAVAWPREGQHPIAQIGVEVGTDPARRRAVSTWEKQDDGAVHRTDQRDLHRAQRSPDQSRGHATIMAAHRERRR